MADETAAPAKPGGGKAMSKEAGAKLVQQARKEFDAGILADRENRDRGLEDGLFVGDPAGQWPAQVRQQREREGRPCLTVNELAQFIRQVTGDVRLNRPSIKVHPAEDGDIEVANAYEGLIRSIEDASDATRVYVERVEDAARSNMGFMRVTTEYASDETFDLDLRIRAIENPFSVVWDPSSSDPTLRDARWMLVYDDMPVDDFKDAWPKAVVQGFDGITTVDGAGSTTGQGAPDAWINENTIRVAEYWVVEREEVELLLLSDGRTVDAAEFSPEPTIDEATGQPVPAPTVIRRRKALRPKVCQYMISGAEVLSGPHEWPGDRIPIVPVWGEVYRIGARKVRKSLITDSKDAMRMRNYAHSAYVERTALAPKAPWLATQKMIGEDAQAEAWRTANQGNPSVLIYTPDTTVPGAKPERIDPPKVEAAWIQEMVMSQEMLHATTGIYPAALGQRSNETSGKAINARKAEADVGAFVYQDNLIGGIREVGRICVQMIPKVYDGARQIRIIGPMEEAGVQKINQAGGLDLTQGKYDISISTGPAFSTRRQEAAEGMIAFSQTLPPQGAMMLAPHIAKNQDWPQAEEVSKLFEPLIQSMMPPPPGTPPPPDPKAEAAKMQAEMQMASERQRMQFEGEKHQADMAMKQMDMAFEREKMAFEIKRQEMEIEKIRVGAAAQAHAFRQRRESAEKAA